MCLWIWTHACRQQLDCLVYGFYGFSLYVISNFSVVHQRVPGCSFVPLSWRSRGSSGRNAGLHSDRYTSVSMCFLHVWQTETIIMIYFSDHHSPLWFLVTDRWKVRCNQSDKLTLDFEWLYLCMRGGWWLLIWRASHSPDLSAIMCPSWGSLRDTVHVRAPLLNFYKQHHTFIKDVQTCCRYLGVPYIHSHTSLR